jgi:DNA-binding transcriptional LysR family regulator
MQLESLKVFCDVGRLGSISVAAAENHLSQSAVSLIVHHLEKRLGVTLIDRSSRPLKATAEGKIFSEGCKRVLDQYFELEAAVRDTYQQLAMIVRVAAIYSVGLGDMGEYVERFSAQYPQAKVHIEYLHPDRVHEKVLDGTADLGLVSFPRKSRKLAVLPWREEEMVLVCHPSHALAAQTLVRPSQLNGEEYIGFDKQLVIRREVDRYLRDNNIVVKVALEFDNVENIKKAIEISAGIALLPEPTLRREVRAGTLTALPLSGQRFVRPLGIIYRRHVKLSAMAEKFIELLRHPENCRSPDTRILSTSARIARPRQRNDGALPGRARGALKRER